ncbi:hypothetical protein UPYG_G00158010, partial [Umbra pygmaea]
MFQYLIIMLHLMSSTGASQSGIVGGKEAKPHSRPYMVSVQHNKQHHVCGGVLIHKDFVLTSAHCLRDAYPLTVLLGAHNNQNKERTWQKIQVARYHRHPLHQNITQTTYDIMLLKLKTTAQLNKDVRVIGLSEKHIKPDTRCCVAGWGKTNSKNEYGSDVLMEAEVTVESNSECKKWWQYYFYSDQMICTKTNGGKGFCQGDSGGPLICENKVH